MTENIRFHIIVPVYKAEKYLNECVESVLGQSYGNFILYLIDDGSPDHSPALCDELAQRDPRVKVLHKENRGALHSRVCGLAMAWERTPGPEDYVMFLDSDDWLNPGALETVAGAVEGSGCDCVIYGAARVLEDGSVHPLSVPPQAPMTVTDREELFRIVTLDRNVGYFTLWRKAARLDRLPHDPADYAPYVHIFIGEDGLQSLDIYRSCRSFRFLPDILYSYRMNPDSVSQTLRYENYRVDYTVQSLEAALLKEEGLDRGDFWRAYRSFAIHALTGTMVRIAEMKTGRKERKALYREIKQTPYWREVLDGGGYDLREVGKMALLYEAFRRGWYGLILVMVAAYRLVWKE